MDYSCRTCEHDHYLTLYNLESFIMTSCVNKTCICKEYVPSDNLEYIEWKYERSLK